MQNSLKAQLRDCSENKEHAGERRTMNNNGVRRRSVTGRLSRAEKRGVVRSTGGHDGGRTKGGRRSPARLLPRLRAVYARHEGEKRSATRTNNSNSMAWNRAPRRWPPSLATSYSKQTSGTSNGAGQWFAMSSGGPVQPPTSNKFTAMWLDGLACRLCD